MTNKEAIEQLKERLAITDYRQQIPEYYEAIEMAAEALEKQIPKKPKHIGKIDENGNAEVECDCFASQDVSIKTIKRVYCWRCGQCLDWEGIE